MDVKAWYMTSTVEHRLRAVRHSSPNRIRIIESRSIGWARQETRVRRGTHIGFLRKKPEGNRPLGKGKRRQVELLK
jgi:hypothetical protein